LPMLIAKAPKLYHELSSGIRTNLTLDQAIQLALLAAKVEEKDIKKGVFNPHTDVFYATVMTRDGAANVLVPNPERIRLLRDQVFGSGTLGPGAVGSLAEQMKTEKARVLVKNGTRKAEQSEKASDLLNSSGVIAVDQGSAGQVYSQTILIDHSGKPYTLKYIIETLKVPNNRIKINYDPAATVDIEVVVGIDWNNPLP